MSILKIDTKSNCKKLLLIAVLFILVGVAGMIINGFNLGIDFAGGSIAQFELNRNFTVEEIRAISDKYDKNIVISSAGDNGTQVIIKSTVHFDEETKNALIKDMTSAFSLSDKDVLSFDTVSPTIGKELKTQAVKASLITIVCVLLYITFRIEFVSGLASIIALLHDVLIMLGFYALLGLQVNSSFIAAVLTILGYSINSSIVVFDRIKQVKRKYGKYDYAAITDDALRNSCKRTLYTTLTTLFAVLCLYIFGVESIREFTLPMIVGFIAGAYSSLFVAPSVWYLVKTAQSSKRSK